MYIYNAHQIKSWDAFTMKQESISSVDLMERAALKCVEWIMAQPWQNRNFQIFCGKGNNGGDGLAIARLLVQRGIIPDVYILEFGHKGSEDFQVNLQRIHEIPINLHFLQNRDSFPLIQPNNIIIDCLFGAGLNRPVEGLNAHLIRHLNQSTATIVSIDLPSGLYCDQASAGNVIANASYTLTFQAPKLSLLMAENAGYMGEVIVLDIGLSKEFTLQEKAPFQLTDAETIQSIFKKRKRFAHKGTYGHALLITGSYGKIGAAVLTTKACLKSGAGLTTVHIPQCGYAILQMAAPEAMVLSDRNDAFLTCLPTDIEKYNAVGIGPGIGTEVQTQQVVQELISRYSGPIVLDADALNCLSMQAELLKKLPEQAILTPHPKEFERLFGPSRSDFERVEKALYFAKDLNCILVLKGHHTLIALPNGRAYFNSTGNAGMAKGGSGDVLTGILTSLLAQGYTPQNAALLGVYLHGLAGDFAAETLGMEAMTATDLILFLSQAFISLSRPTSS